MRMPKHHYSNFLISVQFDSGFMPDTIAGKIARCGDFLEDLGNLARENGKRLYSTYSVVSGQNDAHAHFAVSWLPLVGERIKTAKKSEQPISRYTVTRLLDDNYFYVDNPKQAIKRVTHDKSYVTIYVIEQPKDGQTTIYSAFYTHPDFVPRYSEHKIHSYCSKQQFEPPKKWQQIGCIRKLILISSAVIGMSVLISSTIVMLL